MEILAAIEKSVGIGSQAIKLTKLHELFELCNGKDEIDYIVRLLQRNLRLGMTEKTIFPLMEEYLGKPTTSITEERLAIYAPMLARPLQKLEEAIKWAKGRRIATEIKYDGERTNIYYNRSKGLLKLMSRNGKEQNESFPDLYQRIQSQLDLVSGL